MQDLINVTSSLIKSLSQILEIGGFQIASELQMNTRGRKFLLNQYYTRN